MTHYTVAIIIPDDVPNIEDFVDKQMAPFDEMLDVEPYACYSVEQAAEDIASKTRRLELIIRRNEDGYDIEQCRQALARLRQLTPEEAYERQRQSYDEFNEEGQPLSTSNPDSKWDWYVIGGRWDGWIHDREGAGERVEDNLAITEEAVARRKIPHAIITPDGRWHERGAMGWFGMLLTENESWDDEALALFARYPAHRVIIVDAHV